MTTNTHYDVLIVGAGIAGCALAKGLSNLYNLPVSPASRLPRPLRILLLERSLAEPDRIVGELLQPGGVRALKSLHLAQTLSGIDAIPARGYCVVEASVGRSVHIPYPGGEEGRSFHHGRFVVNLRNEAQKAPGVDVLEASVTELLEDAGREGRVVGVRATRKRDGAAEETLEFAAGLVVVADGCFSNFRSSVLSKPLAAHVTLTKSHFIGVVLEDAKLPIPNTGTVALVRGSGPVLLYQIGQRDTRMLVDVKAPLPSDIKGHILANIVPQLPAQLHTPIKIALEKDRIRRMPNSFLPPLPQSHIASPFFPSLSLSSHQATPGKKGVILIGDAWNMRHPLTGGGMTVALNDVVYLSTCIRDAIAKQALHAQDGDGDSDAVQDTLASWPTVERDILCEWWWKRKGLSSTINILSVALYDLFGADDALLEILRTGCFGYFEMGGRCTSDPVSLLAGIAPSPVLLFIHFFAVAFYSIWILFTYTTPTTATTTKTTTATTGASKAAKRPEARPDPYWLLKPWQLPAKTVLALRVFWKACVVFGPLLWTEVRWWAPSVPASSSSSSSSSDSSSSTLSFLVLVGLVGLVVAAMYSGAVPMRVPGLMLAMEHLGAS